MPSADLDKFSAYLTQAFSAHDPCARDGLVLRATLDLGAPDRVSDRLASIDRAMAQARVGIIAAPGPVASLRDVLATTRLNVGFVGRANGGTSATALAVLHAPGMPAAPTEAAPPTFRVLAIVPTYNEEDIVAQTLRDLIDQGLEPYVIDNWSTDATLAQVEAMQDRIAGFERFPARAPQTYDLTAILARVEEIACSQTWATWVMLHDADERRRSPWPNVRLKDALWHVDRCGYTCIDHVTMTFWPTDEGFDPGRDDLEGYFRHFEFSAHPGHFHQRRGWRQRDHMRVALAHNAGHDVAFPGRCVYPYKFLLKHYPLRSSAQGARKLRDRRARWNATERAYGWHAQYEGVEASTVLRSPDALIAFGDDFAESYVLERISGIGIFEAPPPWATPPFW